MGELSADFIAPASGGWEPQRRFNFFLDLGGGPASPTGANSIRLAVERAFLPSAMSEEIALPYGNSRVYVAGQQVYESGRIAVRDFVEEDVFGKLWDWRLKVQDEEDNIGFAARYKTTGIIRLVGPDDTLPRSWQLRGMWPQQIRPNDLSYTESAIVLVDMTLRFDKAVRSA